MLVRVSVGLHPGGVGALVLAPRSWPLVVGALLADHVTVVSAGLNAVLLESSRAGERIDSG